MKLFPVDDEVVLYTTGFEADLLGRKKLAKQLSDLVERIEDPVVLALDDKWGTGKTFFLKRWVGEHTKDASHKAVTVYFDAFEHDYLTDPLVSIITAISERFPPKKGVNVKKLKTAASRLVKPVTMIALNVLTHVSKEQLNEIGGVLADAASDELKRAADNLWKAEEGRKDAVEKFKKELIALTTDGEKPLVIVIDELDRCRPDYALSVLEIIKHFFAVPKVHFILGINGNEFQSSVRARYGAEIDAERYLRKFINVTFSLPKSLDGRGQNRTIETYANKLIGDMGLPEELAKHCVDVMKHVEKQNEISLRDIGKIMTKIALIPSEKAEKKLLWGGLDILCSLLISSVVDPKLHAKFVTQSATTDEIRKFVAATSDVISDTEEARRTNTYDHEVKYLFAHLIYCFSKDHITTVPELALEEKDLLKSFDTHGTRREPKDIVRSIQQEWVDIFRI